MSDKGLQNKFCSRPFEWFEVHGKKGYFCCPGWISIPGVPMDTVSVSEAWNNDQARKFRSSIIDGSFRYCDPEQCIFMNQDVPQYWEHQGSPLKERSNIRDPRLLAIMDGRLTELKDGPFSLSCGYDRTCNLSCPSCRKESFVLSKEEQPGLLEFQERLLSGVNGHLKLLYVSGTGDPFASVVYQELLKNRCVKAKPEMEIHLGTNGLLWNEHNWLALGEIRRHITTAHISVDAVTKETYESIRRGGNWETLITNLGFISELRKKGILRFVTLSFVIQRKNYRQMIPFIRMVQDLGFDLAYFHKFHDWNCLDRKGRKREFIHKPGHPEFLEFLKVLTDPRLDAPNVGLYCHYPLRRRALKYKKFPGGLRVLQKQMVLKIMIIDPFKSLTGRILRKLWKLFFN